MTALAPPDSPETVRIARLLQLIAELHEVRAQATALMQAADETIALHIARIAVLEGSNADTADVSIGVPEERRL